MIIAKNSNFVLIAHTSFPLDLALFRKLKVSFFFFFVCRMILFVIQWTLIACKRALCFERIVSVLSAIQLWKERETWQWNAPGINKKIKWAKNANSENKWNKQNWINCKVAKLPEKLIESINDSERSYFVSWQLHLCNCENYNNWKDPPQISWRYLERNSDVLFNKKSLLAIFFLWETSCTACFRCCRPTTPILQLIGVF